MHRHRLAQSHRFHLPGFLTRPVAGRPFLWRGPPEKARPGTPAAVVQACRTAIMSAATPLGA
ncbi:MAG: hypothetical protein EOR53_34900, partial [Mesorhizobium sp.]